MLHYCSLCNIFLNVLLLLTVGVSDSVGNSNYCTVGSTYTDESSSPVYLAAGWYLNLQLPLSCSGNVTGFQIHYYNPLISETYCVTWTLWEPTDAITYHRISESDETIHEYCLNIAISNSRFTSNDRKRSTNIKDITLLPSEVYPVRRGTVIGAFMKLSLTEPSLIVIGHSSDLSPTVGVCRNLSRADETSTNITCDTNISDQILRIEAEIDIIDCGNLMAPTNGYIIHDTDTQYGAIVQYHCNLGYTLVNGSRERSCLVNGEWSGYEPVCAVKCKNISSLEHGTVTSEGSTVSFHCDTNYTLIGATELTCQWNGKWNGTPPVCTIQYCSDPGIPTNGQRYGVSTSIGSVLSFTCNEGYNINGSQNITCTTYGTWNDSLPNCLQDTRASSTLKLGSTMFKTHSSVFINVETTVSVSTQVMNSINQSDHYKTTNIHDHTRSTTNIQDHTRSTTNIPDHIRSTTTSFTISLNSTILAQSDINSSFLHILVSIPVAIILTTSVSIGILIWGLIRRRKKFQKLKLAAFDNPTSYVPVESTDIQNVQSNDERQKYYDTIKDYHEYAELVVPYELPAGGEENLYIQLNRIKVKILQAKDIEIKEYLGAGQFGNVHKAIWDGKLVAVKKLLNEANEQDKVKFLQEAAIMGQFKHDSIVELYGVVTEGDNTMLVVELMKSDLYHFLLNLRSNAGPDTFVSFTLLSFCRQICHGMLYLAKRGYVHRDLAARNILLTESKECKIADFGLSRDIEHEGYYVARKGGMVPVKWTAPEALKYRKYSTASDVWSYGCVLYEIWSLGHKPFEKVTHVNVLHKTDKGYRLSPPPGCPYYLYELMIKCWHPDPKQRPSFNDIMLLLLKDDDNLMEIPEEDLSSHPQAGVLGASLEAGERMYTDLQNSYMYYFTLEENL